VVKCLVSRKSIFWVYDQQLFNQIDYFSRYDLEFRVIEVHLTVLDLEEHVVSVVALKWKITAHENVKKNTQGPGVAF